jgi:diacylglycerol kinase (ATP)
MRAAAILGLGCSLKNLAPFQSASQSDSPRAASPPTASFPDVEWQVGMPTAPDQADVVVLFGGDGTLHRHLHRLVELGLPVLVVPVGSGNDFARALGLRSVRDSLATWRNFCRSAAEIRTIDLGKITPLSGVAEAVNAENAGGAPAPHQPGLAARYFGCVAGVGLDAEVSRRANRLPRWLRGHGGYVLSLLPTMFQFAPVRAKILMRAADGNDSSTWTTLSDQPTMLAAFANTPTFGGGMEIAPRAQIADGLLDVCVVAGLNPFKLLCMFPTVYFGQHLQIREVKYLQVARLRLETEPILDVYADGEFVCRTPVEISAERAALKVVTGSSL